MVGHTDRAVAQPETIDNQPWPLERALQHLALIDAVSPARFCEWVSLNPGGVWQLIRAMARKLPMDWPVRAAILDAAPTPPAVEPLPSAPSAGVSNASDAEIDRQARELLAEHCKGGTCDVDWIGTGIAISAIASAIRQSAQRAEPSGNAGESSDCPHSAFDNCDCFAQAGGEADNA